MNILKRFLEIAQGELGVHENGGRESNKRIIEYDSTTTLKSQSESMPWCSSFVNWVVTQAGIEGTHSAAAKSWLSWGDRIDQPIPGCIVVLKRGNNPAHRHVGFFIDHQSNLVRLINGNYSNKVCYAMFPTKDILSLRVPEGYFELNDSGELYAA